MIVNKPERRGRLFFFIWTGILFVGIAVMLYPKVGKIWNAGRQSRVVDGYERSVEKLDARKEEEMIAQTRAYNVMLLEQNNPVPNDKNADSYGALLNMTSDGVMGYLEIPEIRVKLPIYHGTSEAVLQIGAGHMSGTSLPVGGEGKHSVLAAHRGLPSAKLFTDIDQLVKGDKFYVHVLDKVLAYEVDQILPMVEKDDTDTLTDAMKNVEGEDYVTLFTCTPYGVNSHRLLVRGHSVPYNGEDDEKAIANESMLQTVKDYYMLYAILAVAAAILITVLIKIIRDRKASRGSKEGGK